MAIPAPVRVAAGKTIVSDRMPLAMTAVVVARILLGIVTLIAMVDIVAVAIVILTGQCD